MRRMAMLVIAFVVAGCASGQQTQAPPPSGPPDRKTEPVQMQVKAAKGPTLNEIRFSDPQHGWAKGPGISLTTPDGGETWSPASSVGAEVVHEPATLPGPGASWCAVTPETLLAVTDTAVMRSVDEGKSWEQVLASPFSSGQSRGSLRCRAGGAWVLFTGGAGMSKQAHVVYRSTDAGYFEPMLSGFTPMSLKDMPTQAIDAYPGPFAAVAADTAFFIGYCAPCGNGGGTTSITRTADGGRTWEKDQIPVVHKVSDIAFVDAHTGWIITAGTGGSRILATADGGKTWRVQYPKEALLPARAVAMVTERNGYGMGLPGNAGAVLTTVDGGRTWQQVAQLEGTGMMGWQHGVKLSFPAQAEGWAISPDGRLLHTSDEGRHWEERKSPTTIVLSAVFFASTTTGCVMAEGGNGGVQPMFSSTDGGNTWQPAQGGGGVVACAWRVAGQEWPGTPPPGADGGWTVLDARSSGALWGTTATGELWATRDRGKSWQRYIWPANATYEL
ncbi:MAG: hypothetical protein JWN15_3674, partial [Firmicutes bacterium]|nr:hypothetical protein [Bacillota bacterium]